MGGDHNVLATVKLSLASRHQNTPLTLLGAMCLFCLLVPSVNLPQAPN